MEKATDTLLETGVMGVMFLLAIIAVVLLARWAIKTHTRQLVDKEKEILRLQAEISEMRKSYRESIESILSRCDHSIRSGERVIDNNTKILDEIRIILIKLLESKL